MTKTDALHQGSCHCGKVTFEFSTPKDVEVYDCNCSICTKAGFRHLIIPKEKFSLLTGEDSLTSYRFNTEVAEHLFCANCGVKSFYIPRSNPNGISVNFRCVDPSGFGEVTFKAFDGRNWEANAASLVDLA